MQLKLKPKRKRVNRKITLIQLIGLMMAFFCSIRNIPQVATGGFSSILWMVLSVLIFVIPIGLISMELTTGYAQRGGPEVWADKAFGKRVGFLVAWLLWVQMFFGMVIISVVFSTMIAYASGNPIIYSFVMQKNVQLSNDPFYTMCMVIGIFWIGTIVNLVFNNIGKWLSNIGAIVGIYLPFILLFVLGTAYIGQQASLGNWDTINNLSNNFFPGQDISQGILPTSTNGLQLFSQIMWIFIGLEITSTRANEIDNPKKNYPIALIVVLSLMIFFTLATGFIFAILVPYNEISLQTAVILPFIKIFNAWGISWLTNIMAVCLAISAFAHLNSWILGPSNAMYASASKGTMPIFFQKLNKNNIPVVFVIIQASIVSLLAVLYFVLSISNATNVFGILLNETIIIYCLAYLLMLAAYLKLKYNRTSSRTQGYIIPGGKIGAWCITILGYLGVGLAICLTFFQNQETLTLFLIQDLVIYIGISTLFVMVPLVMSSTRAFKNGSWLVQQPKSFAPQNG